MADSISARSGGFDVLLSEPLPGLASPGNPFTNAPDGTSVVLLTLRGAGLTLRFDGAGAIVRYEAHDPFVAHSQTSASSPGPSNGSATGSGNDSPSQSIPMETTGTGTTGAGSGVFSNAPVLDPAVGGAGHDYPASASGPYEFVLRADQARRVRAIQNGGTATGWITYLRVA